jgi:hypothetical protein
MTKIYVNGSLNWLTWKRNIFAFDVKRESYYLFLLSSPVYKGSNNKDIELVKYKEKLVMTCIDRRNDFMKVWIMKSYNRK